MIFAVQTPASRGFETISSRGFALAEIDNRPCDFGVVSDNAFVGVFLLTSDMGAVYDSLTGMQTMGLV